MIGKIIIKIKSNQFKTNNINNINSKITKIKTNNINNNTIS